MVTRSLVYDLPTRLFHWLFAGLFVTAYSIATLAEDSAAFPWHMLAGLLLGGLVVLRLAWGFIGSRHARFVSFALSPRALLDYFRGMFTGGGRTWPGHNPASSWSALILLALGIGLAATGLLMTAGGARESYEDVHEVLANSFLVVALLHVAGVLLHAVRHRDGFPRSMVDGQKAEVPDAERIPGPRRAAAAVLFGLVVAGGATLWNGYDPQAQTLTLMGNTMLLGEPEESDGAEHQRHAALGTTPATAASRREDDDEKDNDGD